MSTPAQPEISVEEGRAKIFLGIRADLEAARALNTAFGTPQDPAEVAEAKEFMHDQKTHVAFLPEGLYEIFGLDPKAENAGKLFALRVTKFVAAAKDTIAAAQKQEITLTVVP